jgi:hypothetical protein
MEWIIRNRNYEKTRIVESMDVLELKQLIKSKNIGCKVILHHCESDFWLTKREITEKNTYLSNSISTGYCISMGYGISTASTAEEKNDTRPIADGKMVLVTINFTIPDKEFETIKSHKFDLTTNYLGKTYDLWRTENLYNKVPYVCGAYKIKGFDAAFNDVKLSNPNVTEKQFAYDEQKEVWNSDLIEIKLYNSDDGCIEKITKYKNIISEEITVSLTLLSIDVKNNIEYIAKILSMIK